MLAVLLSIAIGTAKFQAPVIHTFTDGLGVTVPGGRRTPIHVDPIEKLIVEGTWAAPKAGNAVGSATWAVQKANAEGVFSGGATRGGYLYFRFDSPTGGVTLLEAAGSSVSYVNGVPRAGDPYSYGWLSLPVTLQKGTNEFLFVVGRGSFRARLIEAPKPVSWDPRDATLPDVREGESKPIVAGLVIRNASNMDLEDYTIEAFSDRGHKRSSKGWRVPAMSVRKVGFLVESAKGSKWTVSIRKDKQILDETKIELRSRKRFESYRRTFISEIDGSVQYFGVMPSSKPDAGQALVLSLHGASVEAMGQADAYGQKDWAHIVAPTNRRPFGFDWEEIGRLDALEVLELARRGLRTDPAQTYLTGHSMGGHGTWQVGAHYPDKFAAIGPSAGWISFQTYAGGVTYVNPTPVEAILARAMSPSLTLALKDNFWNQAVYVLHGDADDNVPVAQARQIRQELEGHPDLKWHEQKGAGHWWDDNESVPGAACVDWKPMFDMFRSRQLLPRGGARRVRFTTVSPSISSKSYWATIEQQIEAFVPSKIDLSANVEGRSISGSTKNVGCLTLDLSWMGEGGEVDFHLDGQNLTAPRALPRMSFVRDGDKWRVGAAPRPETKTPVRGGGFKSVFDRNVVFVYGTAGTPEENAWSRNKARYDAETLYYRGNGSPEVVSDREAARVSYRNRNVVLYGNLATNAAFSAVLNTKDFELHRGELTVGTRKLSGPLAVVAIYPRRGSVSESVGVVGGTDLVGMRLCDRLPFFTSGAGFPDLLAIRPSMLSEGTAGVALAGYFGNDWSASRGVWAAQP